MMADVFCTQCGTAQHEQSSFCKNCGSRIVQAQENHVPRAQAPVVPVQTNPVVPAQTNLVALTDGAHSAIAAGSALFGNTTMASALAGEMSFSQSMPATVNVSTGMELVGPVKCIFSGIGSVVMGIPGLFREKKKGIFVLVLSLVWMALLVLQASGIASPLLDWLNILTYAKGGFGGDAVGMAGGILGKGVVASFFASLFLPVFSGKNPFSGYGAGCKRLFSAFAIKEKIALAALLFGAGSAFVLYNFLSGQALLQNSMVGVSAFFLALRALGNNNSYLRRFVVSFRKKAHRNLSAESGNTTTLMAGWALGFALSIPLSLTGIGMLPYIVGAVFLLIALVIRLLPSGKAR